MLRIKSFQDLQHIVEGNQIQIALGKKIHGLVKRELAVATAAFLGSMLAGMAFANAPVAAVHALAYPIGATLIALHVAFSQAEPIKHAFLLRAGPESKCDVLNGLRGMERFPFCKT